MNSTGKGSVLVVDDDEQVRLFIRTLLTNNGYVVMEAADGAEGLAIAERNDPEIDLLLTDMLLPELSGYDLAQKVLQMRPQTKILLMTGYVEGDIVQRSIEELGAGFLDKPFKPSTLLARVREALGPQGREVA